jgi:hypothetical protein
MRRSRTEVVLRSVVRTWTQAIDKDPEGVIILSPYITSRTAETVVRRAAPHRVLLYTVFEANLFASGASQIGTLKRIAMDDHKIFYVHMLHAKILLTRKCATVGSQNLTERGAAKNIEASAVIRDPVSVERLRTEVEELVASAKPVSLEQIIEMERALPPLRRAFRSFEKSSRSADVVISENERGRQAARDKAAQLRREEAERAERAERLAQILGRSEQSSQRVQLQLRWPHSENRSYQTLLCRRPVDNITKWALAGESVRLGRRKRYLVLMATTGRLAWVAVNKTRLSQFGTGLSGGFMELAGEEIGVSFDSIKDDQEANVEFRLHPMRNGPPVTLRAWFDIESLKLREPGTQDDNAGGGAKWLKKQLDDHREEMVFALVDRLLQPFTYERNLTGHPPTRFIATGEESFSLRLHRRGEFPFLVLTPFS